MQELLSFLPTSRSLSSGDSNFCFTTKEGILFSRVCRSPNTIRINLPWPIRMVSTYHDTTAVITHAGEVYTWKGHSAVTPDTRLLKLPSAGMKVSVGLNSIMVVTIDGNLYTEAGLSVTPMNLPFTCQEIVCYSTDIRVLDTDGSLYTMELGTTTPTKVLLDEPVSMVAMGRLHTLILSVTGKVLSYGSNTNGQVGIGYVDVDGVVDVPVHLPLPAKCKLVACGHSHSLAVLETGEIYGWGDTSEGELGEYDTVLYKPTLVYSRPGIVMASAGLMYTVMINKDDDDDAFYVAGVFNG